MWFDEWKIRAGDSFPGSVVAALQVFDTLILVWSEHARASSWVRAELEVALTRRIEEGDLRVVPVLLDDTTLPAFVRPLKHLRIDEGIPAVVDAIMGFASDRDRLRAVQAVLSEAEIDVRFVPAVGPMVACPDCGAGHAAMKWSFAVDERRDDTYITITCQECGWTVRRRAL